MARRYDSRTTIFSPEGRLYQVEYAMEAISHAGTALGVQTKEGVVLLAEKKILSKLLDDRPHQTEKLYSISDHVACAVAGITSDANLLVEDARKHVQQYLYQYHEDIPVEQLVQRLCDIKQAYTQFGGLRPFGVSFLFAGHDDLHGFQLYYSDPSGNYSGWKANCIGANSAAAQSLLKQDYDENMSLHAAVMLAIKVLSKTMDTATLGPEKLELATLTLKEGVVCYDLWKNEKVNETIKAFQQQHQQQHQQQQQTSA